MSAETHSPSRGDPIDRQIAPPPQHGQSNADRQMLYFMKTEINRIFDCTDETSDSAASLDSLDRLSQVSKSLKTEYDEAGLVKGLNLRLMLHQRRSLSKHANTPTLKYSQYTLSPSLPLSLSIFLTLNLSLSISLSRTRARACKRADFPLPFRSSKPPIPLYVSLPLTPLLSFLSAR